MLDEIILIPIEFCFFTPSVLSIHISSKEKPLLIKDKEKNLEKHLIFILIFKTCMCCLSYIISKSISLSKIIFCNVEKVLLRLINVIEKYDRYLR